MRIRELLLGGGTKQNLSQRVLRTIAEQQSQSEKLISLVQLLIVFIFAGLYLVSPKPALASGFVLVPWVLTAYFSFTVARATCMHLCDVPRWGVAMSIIADMLLLFGLIWSFHLQYDQPAAFYLKAPTFLYAFIFIALRVLSFEVGLVVLAGTVAAIGWLILVVYAVVDGQPGDIITRDYVAYMTSSHVLLGAEFDKVISLLLVTVVLSLAIVRTRRLLVRSVSEGAAAEDLSRFFAPEIARHITESEHRIGPGEGVMCDAAILSCDLRGFTKFAMQMPGSVVMKVLAEYEQRMVPVIQKHGGSIDKFMGDGIMATFGAAVRTNSYAADALAAVQELADASEAWRQERIDEGKQGLDVGFAVAVGPVVFGAVGDRTRLEFTVIGDAVNLAAKLEKHTRDEGVRGLTTANCIAIAGEQGYKSPHTLELRSQRQELLSKVVYGFVMRRRDPGVLHSRI